MNSGVFTLPLIATDATRETRADEPGAGAFPYLAGEENALLRVLWDAVTTVPPPYFPLTLYGPSGGGKSHLLSGVCNRLRMLHPTRRVWETTGADFARQFARAVDLDSMAEFRERLVAGGLLAIDGVEELATKPAAQQELLLLLDAGLRDQCHFLFTIRFSPLEWNWMAPGLRSRLEGGLMVPVVLPKPDTRRGIVRMLAAEWDLVLDDVTVDKLALAGSNAPDSLIAFTQLRRNVLQYHQATAGVAGDQPGEKELHGSVRNRNGSSSASERGDALRAIVKQVARHFDVRASDMLGPTRRKTVVQARGVAIYLARSLLRLSFEQLGNGFGNRDHTTVLHAYRKTSAQLQADAVLRQAVDKLWVQVSGVVS